MKTKRYNSKGYVTDDDSNAGMKEKYDEDELARRNISDDENKIRANQFYPANSATNEKGQLLRDDVVANSMKATLDQQLAKRNLRDDPVTQSMEDTLNKQLAEKTPAVKRTPIVTKEQLAASGLSLRDYLNKQQGLTRRGGPNAPARQESSLSSNEGRNKPSPSNPLMDNDRNNFSSMPVNERIKKSLASAREGSGPTDSRSANQRIKEALGMKKGGSVKKMASGGSVSSASRRADGIATKGKTRGKIC